MSVVRKDTTSTPNGPHHYDARNGPSRAHNRSVAFAAADIIEFEPTLWTASVTSGGVPLGMSTTERKRSRRRLDSYEHERKPRRISKDDYMEEGYMEIDEREEILCARGHRSLSIDLAEQEMCQISEERRESNEHDNKYHFGLGEADMIYEEEKEEEQDDIMMDPDFLSPASTACVELYSNKLEKSQNGVPLTTVQRRQGEKGLSVSAAPTA